MNISDIVGRKSTKKNPEKIPTKRTDHDTSCVHRKCIFSSRYMQISHHLFM